MDIRSNIIVKYSYLIIRMQPEDYQRRSYHLEGKICCMNFDILEKKIIDPSKPEEGSFYVTLKIFDY